MRKVLLVSNRVMHYRVAIYNYFHKEFKKHNWEFSLITDQIQQSNAIPIEFPFEEKPFSYRSYARYIDEQKPDVVILFLRLHDRILWPLLHRLKLRGTPVVTWTKTRNLDHPHNPVRNFFFNYVMRLSDGLIVYASSLLKNVPKGSRHKAFVANNTIDYTSFPDVGESKETIKERLGLKHKKIVLFVGRIGEMGNRKKVDHIIDIFRNISNPDYGLVIVGAGMPDSIARTMNPRNTVYLGEVQDDSNYQISCIFKASDLCCVPGHIGLSINQAFYWGLPMITEDGDQPPEFQYLQSGSNGFVVGNDDRQGLQKKVLRLLDDDELRHSFSIEAKRSLMKEAPIEGMFQGFLDSAEFVSSRARRHS